MKFLSLFLSRRRKNSRKRKWGRGGKRPEAAKKPRSRKESRKRLEPQGCCVAPVPSRRIQPGEKNPACGLGSLGRFAVRVGLQLEPILWRADFLKPTFQNSLSRNFNAKKSTVRRPRLINFATPLQKEPSPRSKLRPSLAAYLSANFGRNGDSTRTLSSAGTLFVCRTYARKTGQRAESCPDIAAAMFAAANRAFMAAALSFE